MKMTAEHRAIDKIYRRRDRYEIPDWQRGEVWDTAKKQRLIDSILRGWKLPKFYFVSVSDDHFLVEDGQQRLAAIYEFFTDDLALTSESATLFGGEVYSSLTRKVADSFDDFEIEYDIIQDATDEELKEFFLRLQEGMSLTSSEKLNAVHSKLRDFCRKTAEHPFFTEVIAVANTRYAHFDIMAKVAAIEVEGIATGLRLEDVKQVFVSHNNFASTSAVAKRIRSALDFLYTAFKNKGALLRTRTIVQSVITLGCKIVATGRSSGEEDQFRKFLETFTAELAAQVEMGPRATDTDYIMFQVSVNANVKGGAQARLQILLRKLFRIAPGLADIFDPTIIAESGVSGRIGALGNSITQLVNQINQKFSAKNGEDLFKATNKTAQALTAIDKPIKTVEGYEALIDDLYFLFRESVGTRLGANWPSAFVHVNDLRTDLRHDVDHGEAAKVRAKKRKAGTTFTLYAGGGTPDTVDPIKFPLIQVNLLGALEADLRGLLLTLP
jgi:hypothetical protein